MHGWTIDQWLDAYRDGARPEDLLATLVGSLSPADNAWIAIIDAEGLERQLARLRGYLDAVGGERSRLPLYGVPFAVKDNIDALDFATTAGCPGFAYQPQRSASVVELLTAAGAILVGKTNLDQFATGLVGTRSPYGPVVNAFDSRYVSGGSSSGSASVVARALVPFSLGTDTAGSGRVPAGFNNIVGFKPTRGAVSSAGVVPACRTLDCVSTFALTVADAERVAAVVMRPDARDALSRRAPADAAMRRFNTPPRFGVPSKCEWYGDEVSAAAFEATLTHMRGRGAEIVEVDFSTLDDVSALLYDGPWVAERYAAIQDFLESRPEEIDAVVRGIIEKARDFSAADAFNGWYRLAELKRDADALLDGLDALLVPSAPTIYRIDQLQADPVRLNSHLGKYTNFVNLLDWSALALPAAMRADGLPFGITLIAPAWHEAALVDFGKQWQNTLDLPLGATRHSLRDPALAASAKRAASPRPDSESPAEPAVTVAVVGAHLSGMPLNHELTQRGAVLLESTHTSSAYRLYALSSSTPPKPALVYEDSASGAPIEVELWQMPARHFGSFVAGIPAPLGIGKLELSDGRIVCGFIAEPRARLDAIDITEHGGWRRYLDTRS